MSAKAQPASKTNPTAKQTCADHPAVAEANAKYRALIDRTNKARSELASARASMVSDRTRTEDRAVALLEDPSSAPAPSLSHRVTELQAEVESLEYAEALARREITEARQEASDEAYHREKADHDALANNVVDAWGALMAAVDAEQAFVRDFGSRGYQLSSMMQISYDAKFFYSLRQMGAYLAQYGWTGTKAAYKPVDFGNPLAEANEERRKIMAGQS